MCASQSGQVSNSCSLLVFRPHFSHLQCLDLTTAELTITKRYFLWKCKSVELCLLIFKVYVRVAFSICLLVFVLFNENSYGAKSD